MSEIKLTIDGKAALPGYNEIKRYLDELKKRATTLQASLRQMELKGATTETSRKVAMGMTELNKLNSAITQSNRKIKANQRELTASLEKFKGLTSELAAMKAKAARAGNEMLAARYAQIQAGLRDRDVAAALGGKREFNQLEHAMASAQKKMREVGRDVDKMNRRFRKMGQNASFASTAWGKYSIGASGIAATLFIWQELSQAIRGIYSVGANAARSMDQFAASSKLSADQLERVHSIGQAAMASGAMNYQDAVKSVETFLDQNYSLEEALLRVNYELEKMAETSSGSLYGAIDRLKGKFKELSEAAYRFLELGLTGGEDPTNLTRQRREASPYDYLTRQGKFDRRPRNDAATLERLNRMRVGQADPDLLTRPGFVIGKQDAERRQVEEFAKASARWSAFYMKKAELSAVDDFRSDGRDLKGIIRKGYVDARDFMSLNWRTADPDVMSGMLNKFKEDAAKAKEHYIDLVEEAKAAELEILDRDQREKKRQLTFMGALTPEVLHGMQLERNAVIEKWDGQSRSFLKDVTSKNEQLGNQLTRSIEKQNRLIQNEIEQNAARRAQFNAKFARTVPGHPELYRQTQTAILDREIERYLAAGGDPSMAVEYRTHRTQDITAGAYEQTESAIKGIEAGLIRVQQRASTMGAKISNAVQSAADVMSQSMSQGFFDVVEEGFAGLEKTAQNFLLSMTRIATDVFAQTAVQNIFSLFTPTVPSTGGTKLWGGNLNDYHYSNGGYIGEPVAGVGLRSGASYQFHQDEFVVPRNKLGGGGTQKLIFEIRNDTDVPGIEGRMVSVQQRSDHMVANMVLQRRYTSRAFRQAMAT